MKTMDLQIGFLLQFLMLILFFLCNGRVESISQSNMEYGRQFGSLNKISIKTIKVKRFLNLFFSEHDGYVFIFSLLCESKRKFYLI